jgi:hypothetical protein
MEDERSRNTRQKYLYDVRGIGRALKLTIQNFTGNK